MLTVIENVKIIEFDVFIETLDVFIEMIDVFIEMIDVFIDYLKKRFLEDIAIIRCFDYVTDESIDDCVKHKSERLLIST